jgi:hypothetical protein
MVMVPQKLDSKEILNLLARNVYSFQGKLRGHCSGIAVNSMRYWLSVLPFVHLFILVNSFHLWSKWFEWRSVFYSASSLVVQFIFLVMFIVIPVFHPLGSFYLFPSWPSFGRFGLSTWPPNWAGSRSSSWPQIGQVLLVKRGWHVYHPRIPNPQAGSFR